MSRTPRIRPTGAAVVVGALIGAVALAGCSAGQVTQTSRQVAAVNGANATVGAIAIRDVQIAYGEEPEGASVYSRGADAPLEMSIVNAGATTDTLVKATSPASSTVLISGTTEIMGGQVLQVGGEPVAVVAPATGRPSSAQTSATPNAPTPTAAVPTTAASGRPGTQIVLTGLSDDIQAGLTYEVVLTFARAGEVRIDVPVSIPLTPRTDEPFE